MIAIIQSVIDHYPEWIKQILTIAFVTKKKDYLMPFYAISFEFPNATYTFLSCEPLLYILITRNLFLPLRAHPFEPKFESVSRPHLFHHGNPPLEFRHCLRDQ